MPRPIANVSSCECHYKAYSIQVFVRVVHNTLAKQAWAVRTEGSEDTWGGGATYSGGP